MKIGIPKEIKNHEYRVAITPAGVVELIRHGHQVFIETQAGLASGYSDEEYQKVGATLLATASLVFESSELILKVKEPQEEEYKYLTSQHTLFTYLHLASSLDLTKALINSQATCIAYETVQEDDNSLPLLVPMSQVAGRIAIQEGARFLLKPNGGKGILMGGVTGVLPARVMIIGSGIVGIEAAKMALGLGAKVTILDVNLNRLREVEEILPTVNTLYSTQLNIAKEIVDTDLVIGAVLITGGKAPKLVTRDMLKTMEKGSVIVDVAVDQGGCIETCKPTTHENPVYEVEGIIHYGVANIPGAVPFTSTQALTNATLPYVLQIANKGWTQAIQDNKALEKGVSIVHGNLVYEKLSEDLNLPYTSLDKLL
ncbi:MAG: alanine dehydrogenase [Cytophagales bacterium]|nr:alanine dehydrogenase [Cytophagales bacterium]